MTNADQKTDQQKTRVRLRYLSCAAVLANFAAHAAAQAPAPTASPTGCSDTRTDCQFARSLADEEIVISAQKRIERLQDTPLSVSVVGEQQIESLKLTQLTDYAAYVPGFIASSGGSPGQVQLSIRGLNPLGATTMIATYVDEAPVGSSSGWAREASFSLDMLPYDIERVEILRGPQGTIYGSNSMGGLLKYVLISPDLQDLEVRGGADIFAVKGADDLGWSARVAANVPVVSDKLAVRASYFRQTTPGFIDNPLRGVEDENRFRQEGGRLALLWQPTDRLSVKIAAVQQRIESANNASVLRGADESRGPGNYIPLEPLEGDLTYSHPLDASFNKKVQYYSGTLNWDLDGVTLTSATSYSVADTHQVQDVSDLYGPLIPVFTQGSVPLGYVPFSIDLDLKRTTQEFRVASPSGGTFEWLAGAYYTYEDSKNRQLINALGPDRTPIAGLDPLAIGDVPSTYEEYAFFGNGTVKLSDRFDITSGLRWARNEQKFRQITSGVILPTGSVPGRSAESVITYAVSPRLHLSDEAMIYARVATGYRPGGPNVALPGVPPQFDSDSTVNYELGLKSALLDRALVLNLAAYRIDWEDMQLSSRVGGVIAGVNGKSARSQGVELSTQFRATEDLRLSANAAYVDAKITEDVVLPPIIDWKKGDRLPSAPKWSLSLLADYQVDLGRGWRTEVNAGVRYVGDQFTAVESNPLNTRLDDYAVADASVAVTNGAWRAALYVKNLTDKRAYTNQYLSTDARNNVNGILSQVVQPRTIGISLDTRF